MFYFCVLIMKQLPENTKCCIWGETQRIWRTHTDSREKVKVVILSGQSSLGNTKATAYLKYHQLDLFWQRYKLYFSPVKRVDFIGKGVVHQYQEDLGVRIRVFYFQPSCFWEVCGIITEEENYWNCLLQVHLLRTKFFPHP